MDELIHKLAAASATSPGKAADEIDKVIHRILTKLRGGHSAVLPGLGRFLPGREFRAEAADDVTRPRRRSR